MKLKTEARAQGGCKAIEKNLNWFTLQSIGTGEKCVYNVYSHDLHYFKYNKKKNLNLF
jgi:hypothetical protein